MIGDPGNSFVFVEFEEGGGVFEVAALALGAVGLDVAERVPGLLELARALWASNAAVKPWRRALSDERCLPAGVRGPVECRALARLMAARSTGVRWGDVIGVTDSWSDLGTGLTRGAAGSGARLA
jgi:hypothetical protein